MLVEWILITTLLAGAALLAFGRRTPPRIRLIIGFVVVAGLVATWAWQQRLETRESSLARRITPHEGREPEYARSDSCRSCHPSQYTSWHRSFHRTMTQVASPESIRGNFSGVNLELEGETYRLEKRGDEFWAEMIDPEAKIQRIVSGATNTPVMATTHAGVVPDLPRIWRRISMVTGSHHMQAYWIDTHHGNQQYSFPFTYLFEQEAWVPRRSVFLTDPHAKTWSQVWNVGCIDCHATAGQPRPHGKPGDFDTRVAELGIACEACHGPAGEHVRLNSDPRRRYDLHRANKGDPTIVNPARLDIKRSSEVCGSCHSIRSVISVNAWLANGKDYRAGELLALKSPVVETLSSPKERQGHFWSDGMVRVSGREYNGLIKSPCYERGEMTCLSCHSMHQSSPTNQLAAKMESNTACLQCHPKFSDKVEQHTHHPAGSSGSLCYNCHMPYTTYGLLKGVRSHTISSPSVQSSLETGRPNACNLCHLDQTLDWTAGNLSAWYKMARPDLPAEHKSVAASILWTLKGDAGQRALMAWHMGWSPAVTASGSTWLPPYLATLLDDPYSVIRYIAGRSLRRLPGYEGFSYDYVGTGDTLRQSTQRAADNWSRIAKPAPNPALLIGSDGRLNRAAMDSLIEARDQRVMELLE